MNIKKKEWAPYRRVASKLKKLLGEGPVMDGTLSEVRLGGGSVRRQLTRKESERTRTTYVPARAASEAEDWTRRWREVRELLWELSRFSRERFPALLEKSAEPARGASGRSRGRAASRRGRRTGRGS